MIYTKQRDKIIMNFIEECGGITTSICAKLYFNNNTVASSRRLRILYQNHFLKRYRNNVAEEYIYYINTPPSTHKMKLLDVFATLSNIGNIVQFIIEYKIETHAKNRKLDGLIEIEIENNGYIKTYPLLIEIDKTHDTSVNKIKDIINSGHFQEIYGNMPSMIIIKRNEFQHKAYVNGINIIYLNWQLEGINDIFSDD